MPPVNGCVSDVLLNTAVQNVQYAQSVVFINRFGIVWILRGNIQATPISIITNTSLKCQPVANKIIAPDIAFIIFKPMKPTI